MEHPLLERRPSSLFGMDVIVVPDLPKMRLSEDVTVPPEFRASINAWMLEFFGTTNVLVDGEVRVSGTLALIWMNPRTWASFRAAAVHATRPSPSWSDR